MSLLPRSALTGSTALFLNSPMDNLSSILPPIKRHWLPALLTFSSVMGGAVLYLMTVSPTYQSSVRLAVENSEVSVSEIGQALAGPGRVSNSTDPMATQAELVKSERVLGTALAQEANARQKSLDQLPDIWALRKDLEVTVVPATNILEITHRNPEAKLTASLLNRIAGQVVAQSAEDIRREASSVRQFLEQQIPPLRSNLKAMEVQEMKFRQQNGIVDVQAQTTKLLDNISAIQTQERTLAGQLQEAKARDALLRQMTGFQTPEGAYTASRIGQDEELADLKNRLIEIETQVIQARAKYQDRHPQVLGLVQQRNDLKNLYVKRLGQFLPASNDLPADLEAKDALSQDLISRYVLNTVESSALANHLGLLEKNRQFLQAQVATIPERRQMLTGLERDRTEVQTNLDILQKKLQEARIAEAQLLSSVRIIGLAAQPTVPSGPKIPVVMVLATAAASVLATSVILLLESLNNTVRNAREVETSTDAPVLGVLPRQSGRLPLAGGLPIEAFLNAPTVVEPHRRLLKNIELRGAQNGGCRILVVSSTVEGEGKSDVVARLAAVSAMLSRRTLVIDADLLNPRQPSLLGASSSLGLTHVVSGGASFEDAVQSTAIENLDLLSCGELVNRPSTVIESKQMEQLLQTVAKRYELVLIDTPSVDASSDAITMGQHSNGVLLVVRPNLTVKESMVATMSNLQDNSIAVAGIVVNETRELPSTASGRGLQFGQSRDTKLLGSDQLTSRS